VFGADLARAPAGRAGSVVVAEGYTDVIALHQAGLEASVGIMGTALTEEQVDEVAVLATRVELALDADAAGQAAMLRAARVAARRRLDLRVVAMPAGTDPADLVLREGAEEMRRRIAASVPFARFELERALDRADTGSADGRDRALAEVAPMLGELPRGVLREELTRMVASRLGLHASLVEELAAQRRERPAPVGAAAGPGGAPRPAAPVRPRRPDRREETERRFLAFCVAMPEQGREALRAVREEEHFTSELSRRAVRHLRDRLATPLTGLPEDDPELVSLVSELVVRAGSEPAVPNALTVEGLQLEKGRLERRIAAAREEGGLEVDELAAEREAVLRRIREVMAP
jgi:DNA primase